MKITMEEPYVYTNLNEVPQKWRTYKGARLNLEQVNLIMEYAYQNPFKTESGFIPDYGAAREKFETLFEIKENLWVTEGLDGVID